MSAQSSLKQFLAPAARALANAVPGPLAQALRSIHFSMGRPLPTRYLMDVLRLRRWTKLPDQFTIPDAPDLVMVRSDSVVCAVTYWLGQDGYEGSEIDWWKAFCQRSKNVVEIGANVGLYTINGACVLTEDASYTAVEPHPASFSILCANLAANNAKGVTCVQVAAVAHENGGEVALHIPAADHYGAPAGAHVVGLNPIYDSSEPHSGMVRVKAESFRRLISHADLMKIDVEGLEADLLGAAMDILIQNRPVIFVEVLDQNHRLKELINRLQADGIYKVYRILDNGIAPITISADAQSFGGKLRDVILSALSAEEMVLVLGMACSK